MYSQNKTRIIWVIIGSILFQLAFGFLIIASRESEIKLKKFSGLKAELARNIYKNSGIIIIKGNKKNEWQIKELEAINEILTALPEEYRTLKTIFIKKKSRKYRKKRTEKTSKTSLSKRVIYLFFSLENKQHLKKILIRDLTRFLDFDHKISESWEWRKISRWTGWDILGNSTENKNVNGFASMEGRKSPSDDLISTAEKFFASPCYKDTMKYLKCRLPSKYKFLKNFFKLKPDPQECIKCKGNYKNWIDPDEIEHVELMIASPSYVSVASVAGHLLLMLKQKDDRTGVSKVVSFFADSIDREGIQEHGFKFVIKGIFGRYKSILEEETLSDAILRYTVEENRDIYRLRLHLNRKQIQKLIERLWEIKYTFNYKFYFFNKNCTTMLLNLINYTLSEDERIGERDTIDFPLNIASKIICRRAAELIFPEYWSISRRARFSTTENKKIRKQITGYLFKAFDKKTSKEMGLYFNKTMSAGEKNRTEYYEKLLSLYLNLYNLSLKGKGERGNEFFYYGKLLLKFFKNARDREKYFKVRNIKAGKESPVKNIKTFDSNEIDALIKLSARLYRFLDNHIHEEIRLFNEKIKKELIRYTREKTKNYSYDCGYSQWLLSSRFIHIKNTSHLAGAIKFATIFQKMGNGSLFSLGQDTHLEFFSLRLSSSGRIYGEPVSDKKNETSLDIGFKIFEYEKILTGNKIDYNGWFNFGFGLEFINKHKNKKENINGDVTFFNLRFILNIFEKDNFKHYLNFALGSGLSYRYDYHNNVDDFFDLLVKLDGKFYLFGYKGNAIRFNVTYRPRFSFKSGSISEFKAKLETDWILGAYSNIFFSAGISYEKNFYHNYRLNDEEYPGKKICFFISLRLKANFITKWIHLKKVFNKVF